MDTTFKKGYFISKLPRRTAAPAGAYEEDGDAQVIGEQETEESSASSAIVHFVHNCMTDMAILGEVYDVSKVSFELDIKGHKVRMTVSEKEAPSEIPS